MIDIWELGTRGARAVASEIESRAVPFDGLVWHEPDRNGQQKMLTTSKLLRLLACLLVTVAAIASCGSLKPETTSSDDPFTSEARTPRARASESDGESPSAIPEACEILPDPVALENLLGVGWEDTTVPVNMAGPYECKRFIAGSEEQYSQGILTVAFGKERQTLEEIKDSARDQGLSDEQFDDLVKTVGQQPSQTGSERCADHYDSIENTAGTYPADSSVEAVALPAKVDGRAVLVQYETMPGVTTSTFEFAFIVDETCGSGTLGLTLDFDSSRLGDLVSLVAERAGG